MEFHGTSGAPISLTWAVSWNSVEFHGTWSAPISLTRAVPWNSMEFYGTWSAPISLTRAVPWNSMELKMRQFRWHEQFHGIPSNSMELRMRQFRWFCNILYADDDKLSQRTRTKIIGRKHIIQPQVSVLIPRPDSVLVKGAQDGKKCTCSCWVLLDFSGDI